MNNYQNTQQAVRRSRMMKLEQRILFDGAALVDATAALDPLVTSDPAPAPDNSDTSAPVIATSAVTDTSSRPATEVAFVDASLPDAAELTSNLGSNVQIVRLTQDSDPWQQMTDYLAANPGVTAVHLLSHGKEGQIIIDGKAYGASDLNEREGMFQAWQSSLVPDADLLIYGCKVGAGETAWLETLASMTGADVAASRDDTGTAHRDGNWTLEWSSGTIEAQPLALTGYTGLLTTAPTLSMTTWNVIGLDSNNVNVGPNEYMVGIRVTNNDAAALTGYTVNLVADASATIFGANVTASPYIHLSGLTSYSNVTIASGSYQDFYFNVSVDRNSAAYDTVLPFHFDVFQDTNNNQTYESGTETGYQLSKFSWIPDASAANTHLYFYVEHLISQARNTISNQTGATGDSPIRVYSSTDSSAIYTGGTLSGPLVLFEGQQIDIRTEGATATGGYPQLTFSTVLDTDIFAISKINEYYNVPVTTLTYQQGFGTGAFTELSSTPFDFTGDANVNTYDKTAGTPNTTLYANPAGWNPYLHDLMITSAPPKTGGGPIVSDISMTITGTGSGSLSTLILDYSGSSFHYNADAGTGVNYVPFVAVNGGIIGTVKADTDLDNAGNVGLSGVLITLKNTSGAVVATTTTDANGKYYFYNLAPGTYTVVEGSVPGPNTYTDVGDTDGDSNGRNLVTVTINGNALIATGAQLGITDDPNTAENEATKLYGYQRADFVEREDANPIPDKADLSLTKTVDVSSARVGDTIVFTLTVTNNGTATTDGVVVKDYMFSSGVPAQFNATAPVCVASQGTFDTATGVWTVGTMAWGDSATLTITAVLDSSYTASFTNSAEVTASSLGDPDSAPNNNSTTEDDDAQVTVTFISTARIDVATTMSASITDATNVTKSTTAALIAGDKITYTVVAQNQGDAAGVPYMFIQVPSGVDINEITFASTQGTTGTTIEYATVTSGFGAGSWTTWNNASPVTGVTYLRWHILSNTSVFLGGASQTLTIKATVNAAGETAKSVSSSAWWTDIKTGNSDNDVDSNVKSEINDPTNNDLNVDDGAGNYTADGLKDDDEATLVIGATPSPATHVSLSLDKAISVDGGQTWVPDAQDSATGLRIGQLILFKLTASNTNATNAATNVIVSDALPEGLSFVSAYGDGAYDESTGKWTIASVAKSGSATLYMVAEINRDVINAATISSLDQTNDSANISDSVSASVAGDLADLSLVKTAAAPSWVGDHYEVTFTLSLSNAAGGVAATNVVIKDPLPSGLSYLSHTLDPSVSDSFDAVTGLWRIDSLSANATATMTITTRVNLASLITNKAEIVAMDQHDPDSTPNNQSTNEDDDASATVDVSLIDLSLSKSATTTTISSNPYVVYQLTISNAAGYDDATGVKVSESLPSGGIDSSTLEFSTDGISYSSSLAEYNTGTNIWTIGNLNAGSNTSLYIRAKVTDFSKLENVAEVSEAGQHDVDSPPGNKGSNPYEDDTAKATPTSLAMITGKALDDGTGMDADGFDAGDTPISGVTIELWSSDGSTLIATTTTDSSGAYYFYAPTGTYIIKETNKSANYTDVAAADGIDPATGLVLPATNADNTPVTGHLQSANVNEIKLTVTGGNEYYGRNFLDATPDIADLVTVKSRTSGDATPNVGDSVTFRITVTNNGANTATSVHLTESWPGDLNFGSASASQGSYDSGTGIWTIGSLANSASVTLDLTGTVKSVADGTVITNTTGKATGDQTDPTDVGNDLTEAVTVDKPPVATDDSTSYTPGTPKTVNVLSNDTTGDTVVATTVVFTSGSATNGGKTLVVAGQGTWTIDATSGAITFTPEAGFTGNPTPVDYKVADAQGNFDTATVTLTTDPLPIATNDSGTYIPGSPKTVDVVSNDTTGDTVVASTLRFNDNNGISLVVAGEGTWSINTGTGEITFTPEAGFTGNPTPVDYKVADAQGNYDTATVTLTTDPLPIATNDSGTYIPGSPKTLNVLANDTGGDTVVASTLRFSDGSTSLTVTGQGTWAIDTTNGTITFTPLTGFTGNPTPVGYKVADAQGNYTTATVTLIADPLPPPPAITPTISVTPVSAPLPTALASPIASPISVVPAFSGVGMDPALHVLAAVAEAQQSAAAAFGNGIPDANSYAVNSPAAQMAMDISLHVLPAVGNARHEAQRISQQISAVAGNLFSSSLMQGGLNGDQPLSGTGSDNSESRSSPLPPAGEAGNANPDAEDEDDDRQRNSREIRIQSGFLDMPNGKPHLNFNDQIRLAAARQNTRLAAVHLDRTIRQHATQAAQSFGAHHHA